MSYLPILRKTYRINYFDVVCMYNYNYLRNSYQMDRNNNMNDFDTNYDDCMTNVPSVNNNFQNQVTNNNSPVTLFTPSEGFQKGNLFSNLYSDF